MNLLPLSKPQTAIYEMDRFSSNGIANIAGDVIISEKADFPRLIAAIRSLLRDCDTLRTKIIMQNGVPVQTVLLYSATDIECLSFDTLDEYTAWAQEKAKTPIDIFGNIASLIAVSIGDNKCGVYAYVHHILGDAWSLGIVAKRLTEHYLTGENKSELNQYSDYLTKDADYWNSDKSVKDKEYWLDVFDNNNETAFLCEKQANSNNAERRRITIDGALTVKIKDYCKQTGI